MSVLLDLVLSDLYRKVGFRFDEKELSPELRRRLGEVADLRGLLSRAGSEVDELSSRETTNWGYIAILAIVGFLFIVVGVATQGFILFAAISFVVAGILYYDKVKPLQSRIDQKKKELASIFIGVDREVARMSEEIFQQLSEVHNAKVHPTVRHVVIDFASILQAARGKGVILDSIQCPNCGSSASLPKEGETFQCSRCGKWVHATDIFEKLKTLYRL